MDFQVARALQVAMLTESQLNDLHHAERNRGFCLPNWNIQEILKLESIKDHYSIPVDDDNAQMQHNRRVKAQIDEKKLWATGHSEYISELNLDATHSFDWAVWRRRGELDFVYQGGNSPSGGGRGRRLKDMIRDA